MYSMCRNMHAHTHLATGESVVSVIKCLSTFGSHGLVRGTDLPEAVTALCESGREEECGAGEGGRVQQEGLTCLGVVTAAEEGRALSWSLKNNSKATRLGIG